MELKDKQQEALIRCKVPREQRNMPKHQVVWGITVARVFRRGAFLHAERRVTECEVLSAARSLASGAKTPASKKAS